MNIRNVARAIIVQNGKLLVIRFGNPGDDRQRDFFVLPGGGQDYGEPLEETARRECREEANVDVDVHDLVYVREYIENLDGKDGLSPVHQVQFFFTCSIREGEPGLGHLPDSGQLGVEWIAFHELEHTNLYPYALRKPLATLLQSRPTFDHRVYVGAINL